MLSSTLSSRALDICLAAGFSYSGCNQGARAHPPILHHLWADVIHRVVTPPSGGSGGHTLCTQCSRSSSDWLGHAQHPQTCHVCLCFPLASWTWMCSSVQFFGTAQGLFTLSSTVRHVQVSKENCSHPWKLTSESSRSSPVSGFCKDGFKYKDQALHGSSQLSRLCIVCVKKRIGPPNVFFFFLN